MGVETMNDTSGEDPRQKSPEYRATYDRFMTITKWAVIMISGVLIIMALVLV